MLTDFDRCESHDLIFKTETCLVKKFVPQKKLDNICVEEDGIRNCKSRVLEGQTLKTATGLKIDPSLLVNNVVYFMVDEKSLVQKLQLNLD